MESIEVKGVEFLKAAKAAKSFGYTSDYLGQLARAGKIEAKLVGRSWYVNVASLQEHKKGRYRSSHAKTEKTFRQEVNNLRIKRDNKEKSHFSDEAAHTATCYERDDSSLLPEVRRVQGTEKLDEPKEIKVIETSQSRPKEYEVDTLVLEQPRTGVLQVQDETDFTSPNQPNTSAKVPKLRSLGDQVGSRAIRNESKIDEKPIKNKVSSHGQDIESRPVKSVPDKSVTQITVPVSADKEIFSSKQVSTRSLYGQIVTLVSLAACLGFFVSFVFLYTAWVYQSKDGHDQSGYRFNVAALIQASVSQLPATR